MLVRSAAEPTFNGDVPMHVQTSNATFSIQEAAVAPANSETNLASRVKSCDTTEFTILPQCLETWDEEMDEPSTIVSVCHANR